MYYKQKLRTRVKDCLESLAAFESGWWSQFTSSLHTHACTRPHTHTHAYIETNICQWFARSRSIYWQMGWKRRKDASSSQKYAMRNCNSVKRRRRRSRRRQHQSSVKATDAFRQSVLLCIYVCVCLCVGVPVCVHTNQIIWSDGRVKIAAARLFLPSMFASDTHTHSHIQSLDINQKRKINLRAIKANSLFSQSALK